MINRIEFLLDLKRHWEENDIPNISLVNAKFLRDLVILKNAKNVLEIWTANWFSTIVLADALEKTWWKITTIEFSENSINIAKENAKNAEISNIEFLWWNALDLIPELKEEYDFIFIDWMMRRYKDFLELSLPKALPWAIIILDDVIKFKHKMAWFDEFLEKNKIDYNILPIDPDDWIMMIIKD